MAKRHLFMLGLLVSGAAAFGACTTTDAPSVTGDTGKAGGASDAGAAGAGEAGAGTSEVGAAGSGTPMFADALNPQAVIVTAAEVSAATHLLVAGTDYKTTEIASLTLATGKVDDTTVYTDGDTIPASSAGLGFAIERSNDKVHLLDGGAIKTTFDLKDLGTGKDAALADKAYVPLLQQSLITVLDLNAGTVSKRIDLSKYSAASDADGSADIDAGVYDATKKIAYFVLGRIDVTTLDPVTYQLPCSTTKALIVGIDATTDEVIDLNGAAEGEAAELTLTNPGSVSLAADGTLVVLSRGCYAAGKLESQGIEVLDPATGVSTVVYTPKNDETSSKLILTGGSNALLGTSDSTYTPHWYKLDLSAGMLGDELMNVPDSVSFDGTNLLGVGANGEVLQYTLATGTDTTVAAKSWAGDYPSGAGTALVK